MICYLNLLPSSKTGTAPPAGSVLSPAVAALGLLSPAVAALVGCRGAVVGLLTPAVAALVGCPALATDMPSWPGPNASRHLADPK